MPPFDFQDTAEDLDLTAAERDELTDICCNSNTESETNWLRGHLLAMHDRNLPIYITKSYDIAANFLNLVVFVWAGIFGLKFQDSSV